VSKEEKITVKWRKVHTEKFYDFYHSPRMIRMIKSKLMRWVGYVACIGRMEIRVDC
jgi:hypothetical protein